MYTYDKEKMSYQHLKANIRRGKRHKIKPLMLIDFCESYRAISSMEDITTTSEIPVIEKATSYSTVAVSDKRQSLGAWMLLHIRRNHNYEPSVHLYRYSK